MQHDVTASQTSLRNRVPSPRFTIGLRTVSVTTLSLLIASVFTVSIAEANVVGPTAQNFNPTTNGLDFVTVQSSETLKPGIFNLGLFLNYAVNSLPYFETNQQRTEFNDTLLGMDLNAGVGLMPGWDVGISLPHILSQSVEDQTGARGEFAETGGTEIRVNTKVRLLGDDSGGVALIASANFSRIEDNPYDGEGAGPTFNFEAAADTTIGKMALGANVGYRLRSPGNKLAGSIGNPVGDQIIASAAASYHFPDLNTKLIAELYTSFAAQAAETDFDDRTASSAEFLIGAKHDINTNLALHAGFGTEVAQGLASPDYRIYTGLNYTFGPVFNQVIAPSKPKRTSTTTTTTEEADEELIQQLATEQTADGPVERFRTQAILFEFDSDRMVGNYAKALAELAKYLKGGFRELIVEGHTDSIGAESYNDRLSLRRASAIKRYLVQKYGFSANTVTALGYGERRPIADNGNYQGRQLNRRVEFKLRR